MMKLTKEMWVDIFLGAGFLGVFAAIFGIGELGMAQYVFMLFAGYTVANAIKLNARDIPNIICSEAAGWVWALLMFMICNWVTAVTGGALWAGFFAAIFFGTILMLFVHLRFLMRTWFNCIPFLFATIFCWFAVMDYAQIPQIAIAVGLGGILSAVVASIEKKAFGSKEEKAVEVEEVIETE